MFNRWIAAAMAAGFAAALIAPAIAQDTAQPGARGGFRRGFGGPGGQFGPGGRFGRGMRGQNDRNPLTSHGMALIQRPDVQSELHLDLRQKSALTNFEQQTQADMRQRMQQMFQSMRGQGGRRGQGQQGGDPNAQQDRIAQRQQMMEQMRAQRQQMQARVSQGLSEILRQDQAQRLHQLDLQWRGVLALADPQVAEEARIGQEHRSAISQVWGEFQTKQREQFTQMFQAFRGGRQRGGAPGANGQGVPNAAPGGGQQPGQNAAPRPPDFTAIQKQQETARKEAEEKALALLTAGEKRTWQAVQGRPFTFRTNNQTRNVAADRRGA